MYMSLLNPSGPGVGSGGLAVESYIGGICTGGVSIIHVPASTVARVQAPNNPWGGARLPNEVSAGRDREITD